MRIRTTVLAALAAGLLLTGCSSAEPEADTKPTPAATPSETPAADAFEACAAAIAKAPEADPPPAPCDSLSDEDYLKANLEGLHRHNKAARDALGDAIAEASEAAEN
ncbi:hypothetical protein [Streptomyces sp. ADI96-15]|uniref:hypothetical protein n=1 Tax=Streptomyces sp. ADI96-15 TaxID=1522761 RepID=UPI000F557268|nr:hypothetical protein [Streptomyces sp. ADI96-15]